MTTLVFGGTGKVGSVAVKRLLEKSHPVKIFSRAPDKAQAMHPQAEIVKGDLDSLNNLDQACQGVDTVILITSVHADEQARGLAVVEAAKRNSIRKIIFLSLVQGPWSNSIPFYKSKLAIEADIWASGMKWVVIRSAGFMQTDAGLKADFLDHGFFTPPIGHVGLARIDTRDVGYAVGEAALSDAFGEYRVFGPDILTGDRVAEIYTKVLGRPVKYHGNDLDRWAAFKKDAFPPWSLSALRNMYGMCQLIGMKPEPGESQCALLPKKLRSLEDFAAEMKAAWGI